MTKSAMIRARVDPGLKEDAESVFAALGPLSHPGHHAVLPSGQVVPRTALRTAPAE